MQLKNDQDNSFLLVQSIKNLETATNISNFLLEKNEELQEKLLSYIINILNYILYSLYPDIHYFFT
jgi:hypothetical protein